jgi:hypothetical protein
VSTLGLSRPVTRREQRVRATSVGAGVSFLAASAGVAAVHVTEGVPHGWWLVSFLGLVGGIAQLLLCAGCAALARSTPLSRAASSRRQAWLLWNSGTLLVPFGVLADARLGVVLGSALLIAALRGHSLELLGSRRARASRAPRWQLAYAALLAFLCASVVVGTALAWDLPWS